MIRVLKLDLSILEATSATPASGGETTGIRGSTQTRHASISEVHLTPARRFWLANYSCYRDNRPRHAGVGTAMAVKASTVHHRVGLPQLTYRKSTAIEM